MGNNQKIQTVSNGELELVPPIRQVAINVPIKKWNKIKERIRKIDCNFSNFSTAASVMWGVTGSSFIAIFPFVFPLNKIPLIITISILIVSIISGITLTISASHEKEIQKTTKENVLDFMSDIEDSFDLSNIEEA